VSHVCIVKGKLLMVRLRFDVGRGSGFRKRGGRTGKSPRKEPAAKAR